MPAHYFNIPLANHAGLIELQQYLQSTLVGMRDLQVPEQFHITLVYLPEVSTEEVQGVALPVNVPALGLGGDSIQTFQTPDGWAITLRVDITPQLTYLQAGIYYAMQERGLPVSVHSIPSLYKPHITLGYVDAEPTWISLPQMFHFEVGRFVLNGEDYVELASYPLRTGMPEPVSEMGTILRDTLVVCEFKGSYPTIPTFSDVDIAALTAGDSEPKFLNLPIGKDETTSENGNYYSAEFVRWLERWVYDKRPTGNQGHIPSEEIATSFPLPALYWIGTKRVGEYLWGKAYVPPGETRSMVARVQAAKGKLATSIFGAAGEGGIEWDSKNGRRTIKPEKFNLMHIDLAPPDRAGVPDLAVVPKLTSEIKVQEMSDQQPVVSRVQVITEMKPEDAQFIPQAVRESLIASSQPAEALAEMAKVLGVESTKALDTVRELVAYRQKAEAERVAGLVVTEVAKVVMPDAKQVTPRVAAIRNQVAELVKARAPKEADVVAVVAEVAGREDVKTMVEAVVAAEMGPSLGKDAKRSTDKGAGSNQYVNIPEKK